MGACQRAGFVPRIAPILLEKRLKP